jgi:undecaprenyl phosphate-alpha-L-ara4FN deformylase
VTEISKTNQMVIALRVDVDFEVGLRKGVPRILKILEQNFSKSSFFITMGPDSFGKNKKRVKNKQYIKRIKNMNPLKILYYFGFFYVLRNLMGFSGNVPTRNLAILNKIMSQKHDLGIHGFDHFWWSENVYDAELESLIGDFSKAVNKFQELTGERPLYTGSPNWRTTHEFLEYLDKIGFEYLAEARGTEPCIVLKKGEYQTYNTIQIPITVPCLHEISDYLNSSRNRDIFNEFFNNLKPGINVWCIHDYYEGVLKKNLFESIIREIRSKGVQVIPLSEVLSYYRADEIKTAQLSKRKLPGGRGEISWLEIV